MHALINADAFHIPLADNSVSMIVTSPPYYNLRQYEGTMAYEGGDPTCDHVANPNATKIFGNPDFNINRPSRGKAKMADYYAPVCPKCGALRVDNQIGNEATPQAYVDNIVAIFREIKRVLHPQGTAWLNLGDSHWGSGGAHKTQHGNPGISKSAFRNGKPRAGSQIPVNGLKPKDLIGVPWRVALALQEDGWWLRSDIIWCLSHSTRVYAKTQKGEMPMTIGEMVRLKPETIKLWTGEKWAQVHGFSRSPETIGIEIELRNGQRISCTPGHVWPTERGELRADELKLGDKLIGVTLPEPIRPHTPGGIPDRFGWIMGFYLAEGATLKGDGLQFAMNSNEDIEAERLRAFAEYYGSSFTVFDYGNKRQVHILGGAAGAVVHEYISNGDCKHKHLTTAAWQRSNEFIRSLLDGYLAGDGHYDEKNNRWRLGFARNDALADDLRTIGARQGISVRLKRTWHKNQSGKFYGWRGEIRFGDERRTSDTEIVGLQKSKSERFYDIGIEEPHVFALACGVLTHNSKGNPMPESTTDRPTRAHEYIFLLSKSRKYDYDWYAIREPLAESTEDRNAYPHNGNKTLNGVYAVSRKRQAGDYGYEDGRNKRTVWDINTQPYPGSHYAVFPEELAETCIKAGASEMGRCPQCGRQWRRILEKKEKRPANEERIKWLSQFGIDRHSANLYADHKPNPVRMVGWEASCKCNLDPVPCLVLDPFAGSGTTLLVARRLGRHAVGMDLSYQYLYSNARTRLSFDRLDEWQNGIDGTTVLDDLPLFMKGE